ncbi:c6 transcription factor [Ceraceosorus bombacis]|uniref:C6 transcription factor n=1 Tax=Ceraceosorus bombacis TaxID=401625 RepID=A0A0P1BCP5_9BASI|nr:c6 transcription factor [Ceraceosorus bombacis]
MAKTLLIPMLSWPSIDVVETLVILSYAEFGAGADAGLWMYVGMALRMATDLGLQYEATIASMSTERQRDRARWLFWSVVCLDRITCFGTGRPVTIREDTFDCEMPKLYEDPSSDFYVAGHIVRTLMRRGRIGDLLNRPPTRTKDESSAQELGQRLSAMWIDLVEYHDSMPADLRFSVQTFRRAAQAGQGPAFVYLHVLLQSTMSLLNRPSLMRRFEGISQAPPTKLSAIARHAAETITSMLRFADDQGRSVGESKLSFNPYLDTNPYLDQLILPCGRAFLSEREDVREALRRLGCAHGQGTNSRPESRHGERAAESEAAWGPLLSSRQYAEAHLKSCQMVLDRLAIYWGGAAWPARAMEQESAGGITDTIDPDARDEDAQPAPVRDLEMVLTWARRKARVRRARAGTRTPGASRRPSIAPGSAADAAGQSADQDGAIEDVKAALSGQGAEASAFGDNDWNPVPPLSATHDGAYAQYNGHNPHHGVASSNDAVNFGQNGIVGDVNTLGLSAIEAMQLEELLSAGAPGGDGEVFPMDLLSEDVSPSLYNEMPPALFNTFRLGAPSTMVPSQRANGYDANAQRQYQRPS